MESWLRLEARCAVRGWTAELPPDQFAAWVKLLCEVKEHGRRGGRIDEAYFTRRVLRAMRTTETAWQKMLEAATAAGALTQDASGLRIVNWDKYQGDPTNAERQARWRAKQGDEGAVTSRNENNGDRTGQDGTGRDTDSLGDPDESGPPLVMADVVEAWNTVAAAWPRLPHVRSLSDRRRAHLRARLQEALFRDSYARVFEMVGQSGFLRGETGNWRADFDWCVKNDGNYIKVLEGKYDDQTQRQRGAGSGKAARIAPGGFDTGIKAKPLAPRGEVE